MKTRYFVRPFGVLAVGALLGQFALAQAAEEPPVTGANTKAAGVEKAQPSAPHPVQLSYGVADILKLSRAKIKDETVLAFIANSQSTYNLSAEEIIYLRAEGVSERLVTEMLQHSKEAKAVAVEVAAPAPKNSPAPATAALPTVAPVVATTPAYVPAANAFVAPTPVYVTSAPVYVTPPAYSYYDYYPYSYSYSYYGGYRGYPSSYYGGYGYPGVSVGFSFGGGHHGGGYRGGRR